MASRAEVDAVISRYLRVSASTASPASIRYAERVDSTSRNNYDNGLGNLIEAADPLKYVWRVPDARKLIVARYWVVTGYKEITKRKKSGKLVEERVPKHLTWSQIAKKCGISEKTARRRIDKIRALIAKRIDEMRKP